MLKKKKRLSTTFVVVHVVTVRNKNGTGIMIFIRDTISSKILEKHVSPNVVESIFVELNFRKCKWLLCGTYHPPFQ